MENANYPEHTTPTRKNKKQATPLTVKIINAPAQAKEMTARYLRALYGVSPLEFARQMEKAL